MRETSPANPFFSALKSWVLPDRRLPQSKAKNPLGYKQSAPFSTMVNLRLGLVFSSALMIIPGPALTQAAGNVVAVTQSAQVQTEGKVVRLAVGSDVANGDVVRTNETGETQIVFVDKTKMVIGRNSELKIDQTLFKADGTAKKFATKALGGTFRMISGGSPKKVYKVATPLATMGIRGTAFDVTTGSDDTDLLVFTGIVRFCNRNGRCVSVPGGCQAVSINRSGRFSQPETDVEKQVLLKDRFPLVSIQDRLQPEFRVKTDGCDVAKIIALPSDAEGNRSDQGRDNSSKDPGGNPAQ